MKTSTVRFEKIRAGDLYMLDMPSGGLTKKLRVLCHVVETMKDGNRLVSASLRHCDGPTVETTFSDPIEWYMRRPKLRGTFPVRADGSPVKERQADELEERCVDVR